MSHPVDVVTGRAFTHPIRILSLPGPLPLVWERSYSSSMAHRDVGLGYGWAHTLGWEIEVHRRRIVVWTGLGTSIVFPALSEGAEALGPFGWHLRREPWGFVVDADDGVRRVFSCTRDGGKRVRLAAIEDRNGNRITLAYDDKNDQLVEVRDSANRIVRVLSTRDGHISSIEMNNAVSQGQWIALEIYTFDEGGNLVRAVDADGHAASYSYNELHQLTEDTDRAGLTFCFVYDDKGRCIESWGATLGRKDPSLVEDIPRFLHDKETRTRGVHHCRIHYYEAGFTEVIDSTQARTFFGNRHGTLDKRVIGGSVTTAVYDDQGHMVSRMDPLGHTRDFTRDARGRLLSVTDELGRTTIFERDESGLPIRVTDAAGGVTTLERDPHGNVVLFVDAAGGVTSIRYDRRGLLTEIVNSMGGRSVRSWDDQGNLVQLLDPRGGVWRFAYDAFGRRVAATDPGGATTRYTWSRRGDLVAIHDAAGGVTRYAYDGEGRLIEIVDPTGRTTTFTWGGYHKLCTRRAANGHEVRLLYNLEGELVEVRNEKGEVHRLDYDASGRLIGEETLDGRRLHYRLDALGRLLWLDDGQKTTLTYDPVGNVVRRELWDGTEEIFEHDALDQLVLAKGAWGELRFERDALGRVVREAQTVDGVEHTIESAYDTTGNRIARRTSLGHVEQIERDALGVRRRTVLDGAHVIEHEIDPLGREVRRRLPGGGAIETTFDAVGRLLERRAIGPAEQHAVDRGQPAWVGPPALPVKASSSYRYELNGDLVEIWDGQHERTACQYDPIGQLLARVPERGRAEVFRYDPVGNPYEADPYAEAREYEKGGRLRRKGITEYLWDKQGRLSQKIIHDPLTGARHVGQYRWGAAGLLESVRTPDGRWIEYRYDAFARRLEKRVFTAEPGRSGGALLSTTRFVWDGDVLVHEITRRAQPGSEPVVEVKTYCFQDLSFEPAAHLDGHLGEAGGIEGEWFHYINDPVGTPEGLVDGRGDIACKLARTAFGVSAGGAGARTTTALRFPGQYGDDEAGLAYNRFRYYDPDSGTFISPDPLGLAAGLKAYGYAPNTLLWLDPYGLAFARQYSLEEVQAMLAASEGRPSPLTNAPGHPESEHVQVPARDLRRRSCNGRTKTSFSSSTTQARAVQDALNSPQGQASLAQLDANPSLVRAPAVRASLPWPVTVSQSVNGGRQTRTQATTVTVIPDRLPGPGEQIHIQTAFGSP